MPVTCTHLQLVSSSFSDQYKESSYGACLGGNKVTSGRINL